MFLNKDKIAELRNTEISFSLNFPSYKISIENVTRFCRLTRLWVHIPSQIQVEIASRKSKVKRELLTYHQKL